MYCVITLRREELRFSMVVKTENLDSIIAKYALADWNVVMVSLSYDDYYVARS